MGSIFGRVVVIVGDVFISTLVTISYIQILKVKSSIKQLEHVKLINANKEKCRINCKIGAIYENVTLDVMVLYRTTIFQYMDSKLQILQVDSGLFSSMC